MSDKRPWTPGPWHVSERSVYALQHHTLGNSIYAEFLNCHNGASSQRNEANALLASKSPEMAELLIHISEHNIKNEDDFADYLYDVRKLLKEIGYE